MSKIVTSFYDRIKDLRINAEMSQAELARRLHITRSSVSAWEMGLSVPSAQSVVDLAELFHVSTDTILGVNSAYTVDISGLTPEQIKIVNELIRHFYNENKSFKDA